jgi:methylmalonyl-CoA mutase
MEIAKLRAARLLWCQLLAPFGVRNVPPQIHAGAAARNKSWLDPHVNMLRSTSEALAAVLGGAASIATAPFDAPYRAPAEFSRRIARNTQLILQAECRLTQLIDPGGGSWFLESLTAELAERAWSHFQALEAQGGMVAALAAGTVQADVAATAAARTENTAFRRDVFVGVNLYANLADAAPPPRRDGAWEAARRDAVALERVPLMESVADLSGASAAAGSGATLGQLSAALRGGAGAAAVPALRPFRAAAPFEALRARALGYQARTGRLPQLFLARLGERRAYQPRADFSRAFFEVGGFEILSGDGGHDSAAAAAAAALASGAAGVVLCGSDSHYAAVAVDLARRLKRAQPAPAVVLAGDPGDQRAQFSGAGIDLFIYQGANCAALNGALQVLTGVADG